jgi:hypothetical protein
VQKQIVKTTSKTPIKAPTHMIMTVIRLGRLSLLSLLGASLDLGGEDAVGGEALGDIVNAGADNYRDNSISKRKVKTKKHMHLKGRLFM